MESYPRWPNLAAMMFALSRAWPERPMLRRHREQGWESMRWGAFGRLAGSVARGLRAAGVGPNDRVLIVSENRPEFPIAETALMAIGAVAVPAYVTNTAEDHAHLLRDSGARAAIVSNAALGERVRKAAAMAGRLETVVTMAEEVPLPGDGLRWLAWASLAADDFPADDIAAEAEQIDADRLACLIYTSGTGGAPKGVMLSHRSIMANCRGGFDLIRPLRLKDEVYLSFLPLSHSYEHTIGQYFLLSLGCEIAYARGIEHLAGDMMAVRPTIMTMVPRILEVLRSRIMGQVARQKPWQQNVFARTIETGLRRIDGKMTFSDRLIDPLLTLLVRRKVMSRFGGRFRATMSGGARLEPEVGRFFLALGLVIMQGYGQTEAGPVISAVPADGIRIDTVGVPLDGVEVRIAEDGEILVRGDLVMDGYWNQPEATALAIEDGWLHTGDIGVLDSTGYLTITDRKKDIIVLSGGDNISPARIEGLLMSEPEIAQAVLAGEGCPGLTALVVAQDGADPAAAIARVNKRVSVTERVRRHFVVPPFTIENGLLTPTQKIRRRFVLKEHAELLES